MKEIDLRFPIGEVTLPGSLTPDERKQAIQQIADIPSALRASVEDLTEERLDTRYRPDGWTVRQVVHHLADSHMNAFIRLKLALTEDKPTIRTYDEAKWAELPDATIPVQLSLVLLENLHERWVYLWQNLPETEWSRRFFHPEFGELGLDDLVARYAWHGRHHIAHITELRRRESW